jgi:alpha-glucosidase (family GH31 glycosyl hydrolase)
MYTICHEATRNGVPAVRALVLEYPDDPVVKGTETQYQFLLGTDFLVAPVFEDTNIRNGIYLPEGTWYDYWTGKSFGGRQWIQNYPAPLETLPLFVRAGSLIPMYPPMNFDGENQTDTITLDIWPGINGHFEMVEDEGSNREYRQGKIAVTPLKFTVNPLKPHQVATVTAGPCRGDYPGMPEKRSWIVRIHSDDLPGGAQVNGINGSSAIVNYKNEGYYEICTATFPVKEQVILQLKNK